MTNLYLTTQKSITSLFNLKNLTLIFLLTAITTGVIAQQTKPGYNLLWKITGKGLTRPSYIFGTMHVKDKRVFGFSDSVMLAIQSTPSFALEVHPDTLIKQMFNTMQNHDSTNNLRKLLSKEEYDELAKRFQAKNGYPLGDIDPIKAESMMRPIKEKPDDKKTFVDAYLFGVARGMGKSIYGLENAADQLKSFGQNEKVKVRLQDILEGTEEEGLEQTEEMISLYSAGNLEKIMAYLQDDQLEDSTLIARNKVMVNSILKNIAGQPLFSAVGVAHLPGNNGLIALLEKAGYTLTPVTATFTGVANNYNADYTNLKWQTYKDEEQGFSIDFPFDPIKTNAATGIKAVVFPDMGNEMFLGAYAVLNGPKMSTDAAIGRIVKNIKNQDNKILSTKQLLVNGIKATELIVQSINHNTIRYRILSKNSFLYCIYAGNDKENISSAYANKFFNSFKSFTPNIKAEKKWVSYKNDTAAFSINLPMQPIVVTQHIPSPNNPENIFDLHMYLATDSVNLINYIVRYNDYPKGTYLADKSKAFSSLGDELKAKGAIIKSTNTIYTQGYEGRDMIFTLKDYNCRAQFFLRGNRIYLLLKQDLNGGDVSKGYDFFKTFTVTPYSKATLDTFDGSGYKAKVFQQVATPVDSAKNYNSFLKSAETVYSTNMQSGGVFGFERASVSKYYRAPNIDSVYSTLLKNYVSYTDTLIKKDTVTVNGIKGRELLIQNKNTKEKERHRLFIVNNNAFTFMSHAANEELFDDAGNEFYNSLSLTGKISPMNISSSKAALITNDLLSTDSVTYKYALGALSYYKFDKTELNYLLSAVQKNYGDDSTEDGARVEIIKAIADIKDPASQNTLINLFSTTNSDHIKVAILNAIVKVDTVKGYDTYLDLLIKSPVLNEDITYQTFRPLYDSVEYVAANYTRILPFMKHPGYRRHLLSFTLSLLNNKYKNKYLPLASSHFNDLTLYANEDLNKHLTDTTNNKWKYGIYSYLALMAKIKNKPLTDPFTLTVIKKDAYDSRVSDAVITRLDNNLPVSVAVTNRLLDSIDMRYSILEALSKNGKIATAPLKYRTQAEFAKICLYQFAQGEDEGAASKIKLLGIIPEKENQYYVFKFSSEYNEDTQYTAVCGPYKTGSNKLDFSILRSYTDWDDKVTDWKLHAKKLIPKLKELNKQDFINLQN